VKILVTGGAGFIASHIADKFIAEGHEVVIVDNLATGKKENLNKRAKFYELDICSRDLEEVFRKERPAIVSHHAAQIDVRKSLTDPNRDARINILGTVNLLENCRKYGVERIIFASTGGAIYGEGRDLPAPETHPINPKVPYGASKWMAEKYLAVYKKIYDLDYVILRYGNVYGPRQDLLGEAGVVAIFINLMLQGHQPTIFGDGEQIRDFIYIEDVVEANLLALDRGVGEVFNIGTENATSVNLIFQELKGILEFAKDPIYRQKRKGEIERIYLDCAKASAVLKWQARIALTQGLKNTIGFFK
jgi:UDP-glucose 4-epimerase